MYMGTHVASQFIVRVGFGLETTGALLGCEPRCARFLFLALSSLCMCAWAWASRRQSPCWGASRGAWASRRQAPCWGAIRVPPVSSWPCPRSVFVYFGSPCARARVRGPRDGGRLGFALALFLFSLAPLVHVRGVGVGLERTGARCASSCAWLFLTLLSLFFFFVSKALLVRVGVGLEFCTCAALAWASRRRAPCLVCEPS